MTEAAGRKILVMGYGNPGRLDDGLGPILAEAIAGCDFPDVTVDANYQLTVEDAAAIAEFDIVIFADASVNGPEPFGFTPAEPGRSATFSSHSMHPEGVLALSQDLFGNRPQAFILSIRGYEFDDFGEGLSSPAMENLVAAQEFLEKFLSDSDFRECDFVSSLDAEKAVKH